MKEKYKKITPELLQRMEGNVWSIENMEAHGAGGRNVEYIGSRKAEHIIFDYYEDSGGRFWYKTRAMLPSGEIVSIERFIFGHEIEKPRKRFYGKN